MDRFMIQGMLADTDLAIAEAERRLAHLERSQLTSSEAQPDEIDRLAERITLARTHLVALQAKRKRLLTKQQRRRQRSLPSATS